MPNAKYIVFEHCFGELPVIFPAFIEHKEMEIRMKPLPAIRAGFVEIFKPDSDDKRIMVSVSGNSQSLKLKPDHDKDNYLIRYLLESEY